MRYVNITKTLNLRVDSFKNIDDVKDKFTEFEGIETKVFFTKGGFENGQELDFERKDGSNLHLNLHLGVRFQVNIKVSWSTPADRLISLDVHSWDTITGVKTRFQEKEGTPANQLTLFYDGTQLDDLLTLADYDIENHSTLDAFSLGEDKFVIYVHPPGYLKTIKVMVKLCSTVVTLKRMIHCMGKFAVDRQKLTFNGVPLENNHRLADYKIQKESELQLDFIRRTNGMKIILLTLTGRKLLVYVDSSDTVAALKTEIKYFEGTLEEQQRLILAGKQMEDHRTLEDYHIQNECVIQLVLKLCGC